jgi:hypothetical protein
VAAPIEVDGLKELQAAIRKAEDKELPKRLGEAHKKIGALVIARLTPAPDPAAVGEGTGAAVRPSASKREVLLRVGGAHRKRAPMSTWGKRQVSAVGRQRPPRPFIQGTVLANQREIEDEYMQAVADAMRPAFYRAESK